MTYQEAKRRHDKFLLIYLEIPFYNFCSKKKCLNKIDKYTRIMSDCIAKFKDGN